MSPSEHDLRRALRQGEDDGRPDIEAIMAAGATREAQRRTRVRGALAAGALAAAAVIGGVTLVDSGGHPHAQVGADAGGRAASRGSAAASASAAASGSGSGSAGSAATAGGGRPVPAPARTGGSNATACPATYPRTLLPGGGSPGQFGSGGRLFARPVASITVCFYRAGGPGTERVRLDQVLARQLAASLESAGRAPAPCPVDPSGLATARRYALLPTGSDGRALRTVTLELDPTGCPNRVTNGTALRYGWRPPAGLDTIFGRLDLRLPAGRVIGSPVRS